MRTTTQALPFGLLFLLAACGSPSKPSKNKDEIADFNQHLANQLEALLPLAVPLNIYHERSHENAGLQAVDLFCWGVFRKYEPGVLIGTGSTAGGLRLKRST